MTPTPQPTEKQAKALQKFADEVGEAWRYALYSAWSINLPPRAPELDEVKRTLGKDWLLSAANRIRPRKKP